jgi:hypothetical protein
MIEVLKQALEALKDVGVLTDREWQAVHKNKANELRQAIAELESQEPMAWLLTEKNINSLQVDSIELLINRLKHAHHTDLCVRINGQDEWFQADWLKHMVRVTPPQRTWVDLTDVEIDKVCLGDESNARYLLQLLKEKNT